MYFFQYRYETLLFAHVSDSPGAGSLSVIYVNFLCLFYLLYLRDLFHYGDKVMLLAHVSDFPEARSLFIIFCTFYVCFNFIFKGFLSLWIQSLSHNSPFTLEGKSVYIFGHFSFVFLSLLLTAYVFSFL